MKRQVIQATLPVAASFVLAVAVGSAQSSARASANIPFDFHVGNATLPSGQYLVKSGTPTIDTLVIQSKDGSRSALAMTHGVKLTQSDSAAKLVFNQYGTNYFLSQVWNPSDSIVRGLVKTKAEMEVARQVRGVQTTVVALEKR
jgi:hypothetical protein